MRPALADDLQGADGVRQVSVVALLPDRAAHREAGNVRRERVTRPDPRSAVFGKSWIGGGFADSLEGVAVLELRVGEGVALRDEHGGVVVRDHARAGETAGCGILFLPAEHDGHTSLVASLRSREPKSQVGT